MIVLSSTLLAAGVASVAASLWIPVRRVVLEVVGGGLIVAGLAVIGVGVPLFR